MALAVVALVLILSAVVQMWLRMSLSSKEGYVDLNGANVSKMAADPLSCALQPSDYAFRTEALAAHPGNTSDDPQCILVRDGVGLIDPVTCAVHPDRPEVGWSNPLTSSAVQAVVREDVGGMARCVVRFAPNATTDDLTKVDASISLAGAQNRSGALTLMQEISRVSAELRATNVQLVGETTLLGALRGGLDSAASEIEAAAVANRALRQSNASTLDQVRAANATELDRVNRLRNNCMTELDGLTSDKGSCDTDLVNCNASNASNDPPPTLVPVVSATVSPVLPATTSSMIPSNVTTTTPPLMPLIPSVPSVPSVQSVPSVPSVQSVPSVPSVPSGPAIPLGLAIQSGSSGLVIQSGSSGLVIQSGCPRMDGWCIHDTAVLSQVDCAGTGFAGDWVCVDANGQRGTRLRSQGCRSVWPNAPVDSCPAAFAG